jgi:hypothetical protein
MKEEIKSEIIIDQELKYSIVSEGYQHYKTLIDDLNKQIAEIRSLVNTMLAGLFVFTGVLANPVLVAHKSQKFLIIFNILVLFIFWLYFHKSISIAAGIKYTQTVKDFKSRRIDDVINNKESENSVNKTDFVEFLYLETEKAYNSANKTISKLLDRRDLFGLLMFIHFITVLIITLFPGFYLTNIFKF